MPTGAPSTLARRATSRNTATAALLSAPRMVSCAFSQPPSITTGSIGPFASTVSRCAQSRIVRSERPRIRARRLPRTSGSTARPMARSSRVTWATTSASRPNGLGIRHSAANVSLSRAFSASLAGLTASASSPLLEAAGGLGRRPFPRGGLVLAADARVLRPAGADRVVRLRQLVRPARAGVALGGADELAEQRRRAVWPRLELGVVLRGDEEGVVGQLDDLDEALVRGRAGHDQARGLEPPAQEVVDLVAMAVALVDDGLAVDLARLGVGVQLHRVGAEPHGAAHVGDLLLLGQQVDDRVLRVRVELAGVRPLHADHVAGEVGDRHLHAEADAEVRDALLARDPRGRDLALYPALAEPAGDEDAVGLLDPVADLLVVERLGVDPVDLDAAAVDEAGVAQRLDDREIGVLELDVLADQRDAHRRALLRRGGPLDEPRPSAQVRC